MKQTLLLLLVVFIFIACTDDTPVYAPIEEDEVIQVDSSIQGRLNNGESPLDIYAENNTNLDSLYGKIYAGGFIFYFDESDGSGMVADLNDLSGLYNWGCEGIRVGGTYPYLGTGATNTEQIASECSVNSIAAKACLSSEAQGYTDWFLPSMDELDEMHTNLSQRDLGNFKLYVYWSSTEKDKNYAYKQLFNLNKNIGYYDKDLIKYAVRAARTF